MFLVGGWGAGGESHWRMCSAGFLGDPFLFLCLGVSVSVSTLSLVAIALERYSAICRPLQARVWQTRSHAARVIVATWMLSGLLMVPYPVYTVVQPAGPRVLQCVHRWPSARVRQTW